jgi:hypothetical protein
MFSSETSFWRDRFKASGIHLALSLVIALLAALLVFGIWYPYPYRELSGGRELFLLVITVDVILGPLITLAVFNRTKALQVLRRDLAVVAMFQIGALAYGLWTVHVARPVHMVFEFDRFRAVHAIDVPTSLLAVADPNIDAFPIFGPTPLSLRPFKDASEKMDATMAALQGVTLSSRPDLWQAYALAKPEIQKVAKPVTALQERFPNRVKEIERTLSKAGRTVQNTVYIPMVGRKSFWTVFLDPKTAEIVAYMPLDSF